MRRPIILLLVVCLLVCPALTGLGAAHAEGTAPAPLFVVEISLTRAGSANTLSWRHASDATKYQVYSSAKPDKGFKLLKTVTANSYTEKGADKTRFYKVRAKSASETGPFSAVVASIAAPTRFSCAVDWGVLSLFWKKPANSTGVTIERAPAKDGPWTQVAEGVTGESWHADVTDIQTTYFRLVSEYGASKTGATTAVGVFQPISGVKVICGESYLTGPTDVLNVKWSASVGATCYEVYRASLPSDDYQLLGVTAELYFRDRREPLIPYAYKVRPLYGTEPGAMSAPVTLWSGMKSNVAVEPGVTSASGVVLVVNKKAQVVTAYTQDASGNYTVVLRHMICSTGKVYDRTENGDYTLKSKMDEWYRYPSGVYIRYPSIYQSGYFFHSVLYGSGKSVMSSTVARLGTRQSLGCIRLKVSDAQWVYKNLVNGTKVQIVDGKDISSLRNALKPKKVSVK